MKVIHVEDEDFKYIEKCIENGEDAICISNEDGDEVIQLNLKKKSKGENSAENIVVKWAKNIQRLSKQGYECGNTEFKREMLQSIYSYCDAVIAAATSGS